MLIINQCWLSKLINKETMHWFDGYRCVVDIIILMQFYISKISTNFSHHVRFFTFI